MIDGEEVLTSFEYEHSVFNFSIATIVRAWMALQRFDLLRVRACRAYRFHHHHCSRMVNGEEVLTFFEHKHSVLTFIHRHHYSSMVDGKEVLTSFEYHHSCLRLSIATIVRAWLALQRF
mmetsp:Transcript_64245/g.110295  ORF Transcript_64245/g.110295 Transcript_64245/m.110295 type:complete len:119 (+) Transcript_64245:102-458(+)